MKDRITITFQPAEDVLSLLDKAVEQEISLETPGHGLRTKVINRCIRQQLANGAKKVAKKAGQRS